ncbi:MAG: phenylalanine--tRNA ligase subunit beta [Patescibacteria group bacterium]|jgi:phenylalanyl-tRNA synthetase beta chain
MYLSLNWLKDFINLPKNIKPEEIGEKLTNHTVEVEKIEKQSDRFKNIVVGRVLEVKKHPNSDHLNLTKVDIGLKEPLDIVCGASNVAAKQLVPVAIIGAELPNGMKIEEREVRGEKSFGMICAEDELGLGEGHDGIMVLEKAKVGQDFGEYLKLDDIILEVDNKSLSNRPDLWGHLGIARELAVILETKTTGEFKNIFETKLANNDKAEKIAVKVEDETLCPRYMAIKITGLEIKDSPEWLQKRLSAVGMRPINNIVDATNYVMLELGQPLHAFDAEKTKKIIVRRAKNGESIKTLDGLDRKLDDNMLVIADDEKSVAIAGVMGSENSEISNDTKNIILEAANFNASSVRKTSTKLSLRTEASMRFEKSLDPALCPIALARALEIIKKTCPEAKIDSQVTDINNYLAEPTVLEINLTWISQRLGEDLGKKKIIKILDSLGFKVESISAHVIKVSIPSWRATKDIKIKEDVLEEIVRIYGYNNIKTQTPSVTMEAPQPNEERLFERTVKNILTSGAMATETLNYSFLNEEKMTKLKMSSQGLIKLANPISNLHTHLRADLFPNILDNIKINQAKNEALSFFEIGSIFADTTGTINKNQNSGEYLPYQEKHLALVAAEGSARDAYDKIKGQFEYLIKRLNFSTWNFSASLSGQAPEWAEKGTYANVLAGDSELGFVGLISREIASGLGLKKSVAVLEINFTKLFSLYQSLPSKVYNKPNKYPAVERDLAFVVDAKVLYIDIKEVIEKFSSLIKKVELFDIYEGEKLGNDLKSLAFHIDYESVDKTLTTSEVDELQKGLIKKLEEKFEAKIRNF